MKKEKWITKENTFKIGKVQPKDVAQFLLDFFQFQSSVAYKSVASKKRRVCVFTRRQVNHLIIRCLNH